MAAVGVVIASASGAGAQAAPSLPSRTAAQLIADVQQAAGPGPLTATIQESASLGLPSLPALPGAGDSSAALSLLSGSHTFDLWYADAAHLRVAEPVQLGESDVRRDGRQVWLWNSTTQTATRVLLPAPRARAGQQPSIGKRADEMPDGALPTPQQLAHQILAAVAPSTVVSVQRNVTVAGRAAYQVSVAPRDSRSLIGQVRIAIDAQLHIALRLQVFARGASSPAFQIGFTSLSLGRPAASNFSFTPPPGAKVKTITVPRAGLQGVRGWQRRSTRGTSPGGTSARGTASRQGPPGSMYSLPSAGWAGRAATGSAGPGSSTASGSTAAGSTAAGSTAAGSFATDGGAYLPNEPLASGARPTVMGQGWLSVLVFRGGIQAQVPSARYGTLPARDSGLVSAIRIAPSSGGSRPFSQPAHPVLVSVATGTAGTASPAAPAGQSSALLGELLRAATPVHGAWGSGRLLRTSLLSVLVTARGTVLAGAVAPSVLYADAAAIK